jgi:hypothetical protein
LDQRDWDVIVERTQALKTGWEKQRREGKTGRKTGRKTAVVEN